MRAPLVVVFVAAVGVALASPRLVRASFQYVNLQTAEKTFGSASGAGWSDLNKFCCLPGDFTEPSADISLGNFAPDLTGQDLGFTTGDLPAGANVSAFQVRLDGGCKSGDKVDWRWTTVRVASQRGLADAFDISGQGLEYTDFGEFTRTTSWSLFGTGAPLGSDIQVPTFGVTYGLLAIMGTNGNPTDPDKPIVYEGGVTVRFNFTADVQSLNPSSVATGTSRNIRVHGGVFWSISGVRCRVNGAVFNGVVLNEGEVECQNVQSADAGTWPLEVSMESSGESFTNSGVDLTFAAVVTTGVATTGVATTGVATTGVATTAVVTTGTTGTSGTTNVPGSTGTTGVSTGTTGTTNVPSSTGTTGLSTGTTAVGAPSGSSGVPSPPSPPNVPPVSAGGDEASEEPPLDWWIWLVIGGGLCCCLVCVVGFICLARRKKDGEARADRPERPEQASSSSDSSDTTTDADVVVYADLGGINEAGSSSSSSDGESSDVNVNYASLHQFQEEASSSSE